MSKGAFHKNLRLLEEARAENRLLLEQIAERDQKIIALNAQLEKYGAKRSKSTVLLWSRSVGAASILLGGLGLMQTFFWPAIVATYIGIFIILLDLWIENFGPSRWRKIPIFCALLAFGFFFSKDVLLRKSPISVSYIVNKGELQVTIYDMSQDDYENVDLELRPDLTCPGFLIHS